jgi:beta-lactamase regulating signal transducer with metallopeptidase domain
MMMLNTLFYFLINMGIASAILGIPIIILRQIRKIPRFFIYVLWSVVGIRLVIPFSPSSPLSVLTLAGDFIKRIIPLPGQSLITPPLTTTNAIGAAQTYYPVTFKSEFLATLFGILSIMWIVGFLLILFFIACSYVASNQKLKNNSVNIDGRWFCPLIQTPLVQGIFRQRILYPTTLKSSSLELFYIDRHEYVHIRRRDNLTRLLAILITALHWYNPIIWLYLKSFLLDMEAACDAYAIKGLSKEDRSGYATALVTFSSRKPFAMEPAFGASNIENRVLWILAGSKFSIPVVLFYVFFFMIISIALLTNPIMSP